MVWIISSPGMFCSWSVFHWPAALLNGLCQIARNMGTYLKSKLINNLTQTPRQKEWQERPSERCGLESRLCHFLAVMASCKSLHVSQSGSHTCQGDNNNIHLILLFQGWERMCVTVPGWDWHIGCTDKRQLAWPCWWRGIQVYYFLLPYVYILPV